MASKNTFLKNTAAVKFRGRRVDITKIDRAWEQQRGAMMRIALLALSDNDKHLAERFHSNEAAFAAVEAAEQLHAEAEFLKKGVKILEAGMSRLMIVAARRAVRYG